MPEDVEWNTKNSFFAYRILLSIGGTPYPGMHTNEVYHSLLNGNRMEPPMCCPEEM